MFRSANAGRTTWLGLRMAAGVRRRRRSFGELRPLLWRPTLPETKRLLSAHVGMPNSFVCASKADGLHSLDQVSSTSNRALLGKGAPAPTYEPDQSAF